MRVETYVERHGDGPPILLLHGFTGDTTTMRDLADRLDGCGERVLIDLIGHGKSDAPELDAYAMSLAVDQVRRVAEEVHEPPVIVGYSMGARVALAAAVASVATRSLVLIGGRAGIRDAEERFLRRCADDGLADEIVERGMKWFVDYWAAQPIFATQRALGTRHHTAARLQRLGNSPHALAASLRGMGPGAQEPLHGRLSEVDVPTLVAIGELDVPFRPIADELVELLPRAELCVIAGVGHAAHLEAPGPTSRIIREFLTRT